MSPQWQHIREYMAHVKEHMICAVLSTRLNECTYTKDGLRIFTLCKSPHKLAPFYSLLNLLQCEHKMCKRSRWESLWLSCWNTKLTSSLQQKCALALAQAPPTPDFFKPLVLAFLCYVELFFFFLRTRAKGFKSTRSPFVLLLEAQSLIPESRLGSLVPIWLAKYLFKLHLTRSQKHPEIQVLFSELVDILIFFPVLLAVKMEAHMLSMKQEPKCNPCHRQLKVSGCV